jgi:hypothetical protein
MVKPRPRKRGSERVRLGQAFPNRTRQGRMVVAVVMRKTAHGDGLLANEGEQIQSPYPMTPVPPVAAITWPWMNSASGLSRYSTSEA